MPLERVAPGLHTLRRPLRFVGVEIGARMTALELEGGLLLHSPLNVEPTELGSLGAPRWVLAPNKLHHMFIGPWIERGAEGWCAPGLPEKRPELTFSGVVTETCSPFGDEVLLVPLSCFEFTNEVVLLHRPSRTLVVTDLVFNFGPDAPLFTKVAMFGSGVYPGCNCSVLERVGMNRPAARRDLAQLLALDFDRLIPAHGEIVETGGKEALRKAFSWLGAL